MFKVPEKQRLMCGPLASDSSFGNNGAFEWNTKYDETLHQLAPQGYKTVIIASNGLNWEHVSVHCIDIETNKPFTPSWKIMCEIKNIFWDEEDCVVQYHPPKSEYVNNHEHVLHLWKPIGIKIPLPPSQLVGIKNGKG